MAHSSSISAAAVGWSSDSRRTLACQYGSLAEFAIIVARQAKPFTDLFDFAKRVDKRQVNRRTIEALIRAGIGWERHRVDRFMAERAVGKNVVGCHSLEELVKSLASPRKVMLMIKAGPPCSLPYAKETTKLLNY